MYPSLREAMKLAYTNGQSILGWHGVIFQDGKNLDGIGDELGVVWWCRRPQNIEGHKVLESSGSDDIPGPGRYRIQYWTLIKA